LFFVFVVVVCFFYLLFLKNVFLATI